VRVRPVILTLCAAAALGAANPPAAFLRQLDAAVPMRDGVRLSTNVFRPDIRARVPAILLRTPYNKGSDLPSGYQLFLDRGYAVVVQDVRGRYDSEGVFRPLTQEGPDGYDTLEWIARQPWSDGGVAMTGGSYLGIAQWKVALLNNPHLKAIAPVVSGYDDYRDRYYSTGGALKLGQRLQWMRENLRAPEYAPPPFEIFVRHLPLRTADRAVTGRTVDFWRQLLDHPAEDSFWKGISTRARIGDVKIPVFSVGGWYDNFAQSDLEAFAAMSPRSPGRRIVIGPWPHNMSVPFREIGFEHGAAPVRAMQADWFDHWLKGAPAPEAGPVRIFVMGANEWRDEREWPPARVKPAPFYLSASKPANGLAGGGRLTPNAPDREAPDHYVYDPRDPVPTRGGAVCCNPKVFPWGPMDQRPVEERADVLVYTSRALRRDLEVTGPVRVILYVATSAPDTDFTAKLVDVFPDGRAINLTDGILRLRYRHSLEKPMPASPGEVYPITIDAGVTSNVFRRGHRIRIEISSSNFPRFDRNANTGRPAAEETELRKASQTVYHDRLRASHVLLPVASR
jgi:putative CocE/NonD family hydrolase